MTGGANRITRITEALQEVGLDALVCTLPANVLLLSGYWPVVGSALAVARRDGRIAVLAPRDEQDLAEHGWAAEVRTYEPGSLDRLTGGPAQAVRTPLGLLLRELGLARGRIGYEDADAYEPASYVAMYLYQSSLTQVLAEAAPHATLSPAAAALTRLRSALAPEELDRLRVACSIAQPAFTAGRTSLSPGRREPEIATAFGTPLSVLGLAREGVERAGGGTWCMSGPNSALASGAYARTRDRALCKGDFVLVHCNSYVDGYWTDITRTYCLGEPDARQRAMYAAVFEARQAALAAIRPGARAAGVDGAARQVLTRHGFGADFTHGLGHNIGFSAISMEYPPRLHPASPDVLEVGMTFNVEPAIYIKGFGGLRHCDVVTVSKQGAEVLTPFQAALEDLVV